MPPTPRLSAARAAAAPSRDAAIRALARELASEAAPEKLAADLADRRIACGARLDALCRSDPTAHLGGLAAWCRGVHELLGRLAECDGGPADPDALDRALLERLAAAAGGRAALLASASVASHPADRDKLRQARAGIELATRQYASGAITLDQLEEQLGRFAPEAAEYAARVEPPDAARASLPADLAEHAAAALGGEADRAAVASALAALDAARSDPAARDAERDRLAAALRSAESEAVRLAPYGGAPLAVAAEEARSAAAAALADYDAESAARRVGRARAAVEAAAQGDPAEFARLARAADSDPGAFRPGLAADLAEAARAALAGSGHAAAFAARLRGE